MQPIHVFLLDNLDSFTYNLVDELRALNVKMTVYRNTVSADFIFEKMQLASKNEQVLLMLSPGPGEPKNAGSMGELIALSAGLFPILGICLGHQAIVEYFGGKVVRAETVMHGKSSGIQHCQDKMFANLPHPLPVARYHSLMAADTPVNLATIAHVNDVPMSVYSEEKNMLGFQFHPESILTSHGSQLLMQSIQYLIKE